MTEDLPFCHITVKSCEFQETKAEFLFCVTCVVPITRNLTGTFPFNAVGQD